MAVPEGVPCLELQGIAKHFGAHTALEDVHLAIGRGEFICFLGPSGCGKTTLLRIIAGLEMQSAGRVVQNGQDISRLPPGKRDYGIVFQSYALFPNLTVAQNVAYGLVNRRTKRAAVAERVQALLTLIGLPDSGARYPAQLSGGQQQRVALARALATSPGLLLLDEPLSALDALVREHLRHELRQLQRQLSVTTIMVTHDQEEALGLADRVVVMNHGVIEQVGTPWEVYHAPATPFVARFVGKVNCFAAVAEGDHWFRCGVLRWRADPARTADFRPGAPVALYLRPEDHVLESPSGELSEALSDAMADDQGADHPPPPAMQQAACAGAVTHIDFGGSHCMLTLAVEGLPAQPLQLQVAPQQVEALGIAVGRRLRFGLRTERLRVFPAPAPA